LKVSLLHQNCADRGKSEDFPDFTQLGKEKNRYTILKNDGKEEAMEELWRKAKFFGLGVLDFTREKVEAVVADMVKRGELSEQETPQAVAELMERAKSEQEVFLDKLKVMVEKVISGTGLARSADLEALEKRVADLEKKL
jgi:polyhydroxyalkanoate synthesis regulator phasin